MQKIKIIIIGGYGASTRKAEDNLPNQITDIIGKLELEKVSIETVIIDSSKRRSIKQIKKEIESTSSDTHLHIYCKSYGWCRFKKFHIKYYPLLRIFQSVKITIVDGHGRLWFDGSRKCYGENRSIIFEDQEVSNNTTIRIFYQHNHNPKGARGYGKNVTCNNVGPGIDHYSIVNCKMFKDRLRMMYEIYR